MPEIAVRFDVFVKVGPGVLLIFACACGSAPPPADATTPPAAAIDARPEDGFRVESPIARRAIRLDMRDLDAIAKLDGARSLALGVADAADGTLLGEAIARLGGTHFIPFGDADSPRTEASAVWGTWGNTPQSGCGRSPEASDRARPPCAPKPGPRGHTEPAEPAILRWLVLRIERQRWGELPDALRPFGSPPVD